MSYLSDEVHNTFSEETIINLTETNCGCSKGDCLRALGSDKFNKKPVFDMLMHCRKTVAFMSRNEKITFLKPKLEENVTKHHSSGTMEDRIFINYKIGQSTGPLAMQEKEVCRVAFRLAYNVTDFLLRTITNGIKSGVKYSAPDFNSRSKVQDEVVKEIIGIADAFGQPLTGEQIINMKISSGHKTQMAAAWMEAWFEEMGDQIPNRGGKEIHLELVQKLEIYEEYRNACISVYKDGPDNFLSYAKFVDVWEKLFPNVKIRVYKQVSGKCETCARLSEARRSATSVLHRSVITALHAYHRITYMGERRVYYRQRRFACEYPGSFMSIIMDGMAQNHTQLPYQGNLKQFSTTLDQHLQGLIIHGQKMFIYRTFHTVINDSK